MTNLSISDQLIEFNASRSPEFKNFLRNSIPYNKEPFLICIFNPFDQDTIEQLRKRWYLFKTPSIEIKMFPNELIIETENSKNFSKFNLIEGIIVYKPLKNFSKGTCFKLASQSDFISDVLAALLFNFPDIQVLESKQAVRKYILNVLQNSSKSIKGTLFIANAENFRVVPDSQLDAFMPSDENKTYSILNNVKYLGSVELTVEKMLEDSDFNDGYTELVPFLHILSRFSGINALATDLLKKLINDNINYIRTI